MGLENRIVYDIVDVTQGICRLKQALIKDKRYDGLYLLPAAQTKDKTAIQPKQMLALSKRLKEEFDYILIDCPAGIEQGFKMPLLVQIRQLLLQPQKSQQCEMPIEYRSTRSNEIYNPKLIVNKVRIDMVKKGDMMDIDDR